MPATTSASTIFTGKKQAYSQIPTNDTDDGSTTMVSASDSQDYLPQSEKHHSVQNPDTFKRRFTDITITVIITLVLTTGFHYLYTFATFSPDTLFHNTIAAHYSEAVRLTPKYHCGNSSAEARSLGCMFDLSLVGWVPAPCFDADLNQRFMDWGWRFFEDQNGTIEVPLERIAESAGTREPFWAQHGYHITHCELAWERMHRALQGGKRLTTHLLNLEHTRHCAMMNELRDDFYSLNSQILPLLNTC